MSALAGTRNFENFEVGGAPTKFKVFKVGPAARGPKPGGCISHQLKSACCPSQPATCSRGASCGLRTPVRKNNAADLHAPPRRARDRSPKSPCRASPLLEKTNIPSKPPGDKGSGKNHCQTCRSRNVCPYSRKVNDNSLEGPPLQTHEDHEANCVVLLLPLPAPENQTVGAPFRRSTGTRTGRATPTGGTPWWNHCRRMDLCSTTRRLASWSGGVVGPPAEQP